MSYVIKLNSLPFTNISPPLLLSKSLAFLLMASEQKRPWKGLRIKFQGEFKGQKRHVHKPWGMFPFMSNPGQFSAESEAVHTTTTSQQTTTTQTRRKWSHCLPSMTAASSALRLNLNNCFQENWAECPFPPAELYQRQCNLLEHKGSQHTGKTSLWLSHLVRTSRIHSSALTYFLWLPIHSFGN